MSERLWITNQGQRIRFEDLEVKHLINILLLLRRKSWQRAQQEASKLHLKIPPGAWRMFRHRQWESLVEEARRRGGSAATAADLIDSPEAINEFVLRESFSLGRIPRQPTSEAQPAESLEDIFS